MKKKEKKREKKRKKETSCTYNKALGHGLFQNQASTRQRALAPR
jgi:hypothetical protein